MRSERSLYAKVQLVLEVAARGESTTLPELRQRILSEGHSSFLTMQYDADADDYVWAQSDRAVGRAVSACSRLGLVSEDGALTAAGKRAARNERGYHQEVRRSIIERLEQAGASVTDLQAAVTELLSRTPPELPSASALFDELGPDLARVEFSRLLSLLADVEGATTVQRKVFLAFV